MTQFHRLLATGLVVFATLPSVARGDITVPGERMTIPAGGLELVTAENLSYTTFSYRADAMAEAVTATWSYYIKTDDQEDADELRDEFSLDLTRSGASAVLRLRHPRANKGRVLPSRRPEWRVRIDVVGPKDIDMDLPLEFGDATITGTEGKLTVKGEFSDITSRNHSGLLCAAIEFGSLKVDGLDGTFEVINQFGSCDLALGNLRDHSSMRTEFGHVRLHLPENSDASFVTDVSFGKVHFPGDTPVRVSTGRDGGAQGAVNGVGHEVRLSAEFGNIDVFMDGTRTEMAVGPETTVAPPAPVAIAPDAPVVANPESHEEPFTTGVIRSVRIRGTRLLGIAEVNHWLGIAAGNTYRREDIDSAVKRLTKKNSLIQSASWSVTPKGELSVYVHEADLLNTDLGLSPAFDRIGGVGLGPKLTLTSPIGPFSEIEARGEYHWANDDWTYRVKGEKRLFHDFQFAFGGSYRRMYESNMDWAIDSDEAMVNAFFLGQDVISYYQVEGATAHVSQSFTKHLTVRAEYFEETYDSLKKNTNWSLIHGNWRKEDNPALGIGSASRFSGMRYSVDILDNLSTPHASLHLEMENATETGEGGLPAYTRYFGEARWLPYRQKLLVRAVGGMADTPLPDTRAFRLGGMSTLRGYQYGAVSGGKELVDGFAIAGGGSRMVLANIEYMAGQGWFDTGLIFFGDVGNVWLDEESVDVNDLKGDLGVGLTLDGGRYRTLRDTSSGIRINWAIPVGNVPHVSRWTVLYAHMF